MPNIDTVEHKPNRGCLQSPLKAILKNEATNERGRQVKNPNGPGFLSAQARAPDPKQSREAPALIPPVHDATARGGGGGERRGSSRQTFEGEEGRRLCLIPPAGRVEAQHRATPRTQKAEEAGAERASSSARE